MIVPVWATFLTIIISCVNSEFQWNKHHNNPDLISTLKQINDQCPSISDIYTLSFGNLNQTTLGNHLWVIVFGKSPKKHEALVPEFKYVGNIHGNEVVGRELILRLAAELCFGYINGDAQIKWIIENTRIHLLPAMNPDGYQLAVGEDKHNLKGRTNARDVDLNRNFPDLNSIFFQNARMGVNKLDHLLTKDILESKELEIETLLVIDWIMSNNFVLSASMHGGDLVANYPFDTSPDHKRHYQKCPDDKTFVQLANSYSFDNHRMYSGIKKCTDSINNFFHGRTNGAQWYPVDGGMQDFNYLASNCFEITLELGCEKYPEGVDLEKYWQWNNRSLYDFLLQVHAGFKGVVLGELETGDLATITDAEIRVTKIEEDAAVPIEHTILTGDHGDYFRLVTPGLYIVWAVKEGFEPALACINIEEAASLENLKEAKIMNFVLKKSKSSGLNDFEIISNMVKKHLHGPYRVSGAGDDEICHDLSNKYMFTQF